VRVFHEELDLVDPLLHHPGQYGIDDLHGIEMAKITAPG
jgi:hypothetical protein